MTNPTKRTLEEMWNYCLASNKDKKGKYNPRNHPFIKGKNVDDLIELKHDNDYAYVTFEKKRIVINFQGSDDFRDWVNNLRGLKLLNRDDVHDGFYFSAKKFREDIDNIIDRAVEEIKNVEIIVCGHSRGGALAKEISRYITKSYRCEVTLYTFGSPRIGGRDYLEEVLSLPIKAYHVKNGGDPVPHLPPRPMGFVNEPKIINLNNKWIYKFMPWMWKKRHLGYSRAIRKWKRK